MEPIGNQVDYFKSSVQSTPPIVNNAEIPSSVATENIKYAGFWIRFVAYFLDSLVLAVPILIINIGLAFLSGNSFPYLTYLARALDFLITYTYFVWMTSKYQATLGKMAVGLSVVSEKSENLSSNQVLLREISKILSALSLYIGYIMVGFTERKRALHDMIAGTIVIYKNPERKFSTGAKIAIVAAAILPALLAIGVGLWIILASLNSAKNKLKAAQDNIANPPISSTGVPQEPTESKTDPQSQVADQLKMQMFLAGLPKEKITEVHIGGYNVPSGTLEIMQQAIEKKIGVKVMIDSNYQEKIPANDTVYNKDRKQFDGDSVWKYFGDILSQKGDATRYLVVISEDMFTNIQPERPYIFSRSLPNTNNAIISVKRLQKYSDTSDQPASEERYKQRVEKLALRTLGVTAGLSLSPDASNVDCLMYQPSNLDELDAEGQDFCETTKGALDKVFEIQNR